MENTLKISNFCPLLSRGEERIRCGKSKCAMYIKERRRCSLHVIAEELSEMPTAELISTTSYSEMLADAGDTSDR